MCKNKTVFIKSHPQVEAPHTILQILIMNIRSLTPRSKCYQPHPPPPWPQIRPTVMTSYYHTIFLFSLFYSTSQAVDLSATTKD